jgi:hypothetical protein
MQGKDNDVFWLFYGNNKFFWKLPKEFIASLLLFVHIVFVKAFRQWMQIQRVMKHYTVYGNKLKQ